MAKTGTRVKSSTLKQQRESAELELIIEEFGRAMRQAYRPFIAAQPYRMFGEDNGMTIRMMVAWNKYIDFSANHPR